ncbi:latex serine proteinase inhibitor-like [Carica papaya]|uniref:latex serine proteinase inhibitor-like n=1 Tax=Carica papaya TaxID=3649 RepID=UPI000B8CB6F0|nr:latex serine proteinase inhibitor-like [Carica papaya]
MKITTVLLPFFFFFFFFFQPFFAEAIPILDYDGDPLRSGVDYYVLSAFWGLGGGGVSLLPTQNNSVCPLSVVHLPSDSDYGIPVKFSPVEQVPDDIIHESTELNIIFDAHLNCKKKTTTVWKVNEDRTVTINGVQEAENSMFEIERVLYVSLFYKFRFCNSHLHVGCSEVGVDSNRKLVLRDEHPKEFVFVKAYNFAF